MIDDNVDSGAYHQSSKYGGAVPTIRVSLDPDPPRSERKITPPRAGPRNLHKEYHEAKLRGSIQADQGQGSLLQQTKFGQQQLGLKPTDERTVAETHRTNKIGTHTMYVQELEPESSQNAAAWAAWGAGTSTYSQSGALLPPEVPPRVPLAGAHHDWTLKPGGTSKHSYKKRCCQP